MNAAPVRKEEVDSMVRHWRRRKEHERSGSTELPYLSIWDSSH